MIVLKVIYVFLLTQQQDGVARTDSTDLMQRSCFKMSETASFIRKPAQERSKL